MKSRICFCNGTVLRKDLTRFAPVMLVTSVMLALTGWTIRSSYEYLMEDSLWTFEPMQIFHNFAMILACVSAVCMFSYLTKKKECDAMHALPVRRETFFFTHVLAALIQFVIPFAVLYMFLPGDRGWGFQMLFTTCSWLFYFGLMVFCMMLTGRKIAAVILCSVLSDIVATAFQIADALYIPQLPGLYLDPELQYAMSPTIHMNTLNFSEWKFTELLLPMGLYALGGIALLAVSLLFYRKRKMERAGDFLAERWLEPVFAWALGITIACSTVTMGYLMELSVWAPLIIGLAIGYFAARMLFARSIKVFSKKNLAGFGALVGVMGASLFIVSMDPLGAVSRVPQTEQIESVTFSDYIYFGSDYGYYSGIQTSDPEEIGVLRSIHQDMVQQEQTPVYDVLEEEYYSLNYQFYLTYNLADGSQMKRTYRIEDEQHLDQIEYLMSQPEHLLGTASLEELLAGASDLRAYGIDGGSIHTRRGFFEVFLADCEAGNMYVVDASEESAWSINMTLTLDGVSGYQNIPIPNAAEDTIAWLEDYFH